MQHCGQSTTKTLLDPQGQLGLQWGTVPGGEMWICVASRNLLCTTLKENISDIVFAQVLSDGTLLMKEVRENIEELTCQVS